MGRDSGFGHVLVYKEIKVMASRAERRPTAQRVIIGAVKLKKLKAISYWVQKLSNQGNDDPDINTLDNNTLHDLATGSKSFIVYLDSIAGGAGTPLSYVTPCGSASDSSQVHYCRGRAT